MYRIIQGKTHHLPDVKNFLKILNTLDSNPVPEVRSLFSPDTEIIVSRAPGRLDVMGGIADYSGSLVLQLPIKEATFAAVQMAQDPLIRIVSLSSEKSEKSHSFNMPLADFTEKDQPIGYNSARLYFQEQSSNRWAAYIAGAFLVLMKEKGAHFQQGANILIYSHVPREKGVSSSASLEIAAMSSIIKAFRISVSPRELALLCQKVENQVVGAPCGVMDQMTSMFGRANQLFALLCQPAEMKPFIDIPREISFWGIDSGIRHSVSGSDYISVRIGAFMGQRIISDLRARYNFVPNSFNENYLTNIAPTIYEQYFANKIPPRMTGGEFIRLYGQTIDDATEIDAEVVYSIKAPTAHPIYEHFRVSTFAELLQKPVTKQSLQQLGELMYESHAGYSACGLGSGGTDRLVELAREYGVHAGLFGAKITGGGSGGTVVILGKTGAENLIDTLVERYSAETGYKPHIFSGSSFGAYQFGHITLKETGE